LAPHKGFTELAAELARKEGPANIIAFADALESREVLDGFGATELQSILRIPSPRTRAYLDVLQTAPNRTTLVTTLRSVAYTASLFLKMQPDVELAWTFSGSSSPGLRTTGAVANEIINGAEATLLIVGYSVSTESTDSVASKTITNIVEAAQRGVAITAVFHKRVNRDALLSRWPAGVTTPKIFSWSMRNDTLAGVHAKIIVADRKVALVTSANLTFHGFERNVEMGVKISGEPAAQLEDRFVELIRTKQLVPSPSD
jgi:hypothetical protein